MKLLRSIILGIVLVFGFWGSALAEDKININTASPQELADGLSGIGLAKAEAIAAYREAYGYFNSVDQLVNVKGIGQKTVDKIRESIELEVPLEHDLKK